MLRGLGSNRLGIWDLGKICAGVFVSWEAMGR